MSNFFPKETYESLRKTQRTLNSRDFDVLISKMIHKVEKYAGWMMSFHRVVGPQKDDYVQEALVAMWRFMGDYRFICSECGEKYQRAEDFMGHCKIAHGGISRPRVLIEDYLSRGMKRYMRNLMLQYRNAKARSSLRFYDFDDEANRNTLFKEVVDTNTMDTAFSLKELLARERNVKIKFYIEQLLNGNSNTQVFERMSEVGMYSSPQSARGGIYALRKTGALDNYRAVLTKTA